MRSSSPRRDFQNAPVGGPPYFHREVVFVREFQVPPLDKSAEEAGVRRVCVFTRRFAGESVYRSNAVGGGSVCEPQKCFEQRRQWHQVQVTESRVETVCREAR